MFGTTVVLFFLAEMGDKTQVATVMLAARFDAYAAVVAGTTLGMLLANAPVVWLGERMTRLVPLCVVHLVSAAVFMGLGLQPHAVHFKVRSLSLFSIKFVFPISVSAFLWASNTFVQVTLLPDQRIVAIRNTAAETWRLQKNKGNSAEITKMNECQAVFLKTKSKYDEEVEACLVADYYVSLYKASFCEQLSGEYGRNNKIQPEKIRADTAARILGAYEHFKLPIVEATEVTRQFRENVFQIIAPVLRVK